MYLLGCGDILHNCSVISSVSNHIMSVITQEGDSALMVTVRKGRIKIVQLLIKAGAKLDLLNKVSV